MVYSIIRPKCGCLYDNFRVSEIKNPISCFGSFAILSIENIHVDSIYFWPVRQIKPDILPLSDSTFTLQNYILWFTCVPPELEANSAEGRICEPLYNHTEIRSSRSCSGKTKSHPTNAISMKTNSQPMHLNWSASLLIMVFHGLAVT